MRTVCGVEVFLCSEINKGKLLYIQGKVGVGLGMGFCVVLLIIEPR